MNESERQPLRDAVYMTGAVQVADLPQREVGYNSPQRGGNAMQMISFSDSNNSDGTQTNHGQPNCPISASLPENQRQESQQPEVHPQSQNLAPPPLANRAAQLQRSEESPPPRETRQIEEKDIKEGVASVLSQVTSEEIKDPSKSCNRIYWLNRSLVILLFISLQCVMIVMNSELQEKHILLLEWLQKNAYRGPIVVMITTIIESFLFFPIDILNLGCGLSLQQAYQQQFKAIFVSTLAIWTGSWIGTNLNFKLLKFLFRDKTQAFCSKFLPLNCTDRMLEKHGLLFIVLLRFNSVYAVNIMIQFTALTGLTYRSFVLSGASMFLPIVIRAIQGTQIANLDDLTGEDFEVLTIYKVYPYLSTALVVLLSSSYLFYHSRKEYKAVKKLASEPTSSNKPVSGQTQPQIQSQPSPQQQSEYEEVNRVSFVAEVIDVKI